MNTIVKQTTRLQDSVLLNVGHEGGGQAVVQIKSLVTDNRRNIVCNQSGEYTILT